MSLGQSRVCVCIRLLIWTNDAGYPRYRPPHRGHSEIHARGLPWGKKSSKLCVELNATERNSSGKGLGRRRPTEPSMALCSGGPYHSPLAMNCTVHPCMRKIDKRLFFLFLDLGWRAQRIACSAYCRNSSAFDTAPSR